MSPSRRTAALALSLAVAIPTVALASKKAPHPATDEDALIVHALNRLGYGPRPGDVDKVRAIGLEKWIDQQFHPDRIADPAVAAHLASLRTLRLSTGDLIARYEVPPEARKEIQAKRAELGDNASEEQTREARRELTQKYRGQMDGTPQEVVQELQSAKILRAVYGERQLDEVMADFWMNHFNVFAGKGPVKFMVGEYERDVVRPHAWGKFEDLLRATAESPAMLFYLDNWLSADPNAPAFGDRAPRAGFRRRPFGRRPWFMGGAPRPPGPPAGTGQGQARKRGLNENYAREIMELHTLGVDGGYTQKDVTEVARCFTGWTIRNPRQGGSGGTGEFPQLKSERGFIPRERDAPQFFFNERIHDHGDKVVLGHRIVSKGGGKNEGDEVIHLLATHPSTARFVAYKLVRRFVSDEPPKALVDRAAETFRRTDGDIRAVLKTIVTSAEFASPAARAAKVKTPFEFVVSAARATSAEVDDARALAGRIAAMGMPLYQQQPPTGYKDTADAWVSTSGLLARLNLALDLAAGRVRGVSLDAARLVPAQAASDPGVVAARLVPSGLSPSTRKTLDSEAKGADPSRIAGLILGSPEFQRR
jgi:uncharacterized protein (DUF1800 family)